MSFFAGEPLRVHVPDSYSRTLDDRVAMTEMPYGYTNEPPAADTGNFDQRHLESNKQYPMRKGRAV